MKKIEQEGKSGSIKPGVAKALKKLMEAKDAEKAAEELSKSMEELAASVKGLADSGTHEMVYIAGIPGYQTQKAWFPQLNPFILITEKQVEKVHKTLVRRKLDPAPAMSQLWPFLYKLKRRKL